MKRIVLSLFCLLSFISACSQEPLSEPETEPKGEPAQQATLSEGQQQQLLLQIILD